MVEPLLTGIVLGLIVITLLGLFVAAYIQFLRAEIAPPIEPVSSSD